MNKSMEQHSPLSCLNRALDSEMIFVLLGRDPAAPDLIRSWVMLRISLGLNVPGDTQTVEALKLADHMDQDRASIRASLDAARTPTSPHLTDASEGEP